MPPSNNLTGQHPDYIEQALKAGFIDFEDAARHFSALSAGCTALLTRNGRHYRKSEIAVLTAEAYCARNK